MAPSVLHDRAMGVAKIIEKYEWQDPLQFNDPWAVHLQKLPVGVQRVVVLEPREFQQKHLVVAAASSENMATESMYALILKRLDSIEAMLMSEPCLLKNVELQTKESQAATGMVESTSESPSNPANTSPISGAASGVVCLATFVSRFATDLDKTVNDRLDFEPAGMPSCATLALLPILTFPVLAARNFVNTEFMNCEDTVTKNPEHTEMKYLENM